MASFTSFASFNSFASFASFTWPHSPGLMYLVLAGPYEMWGDKAFLRKVYRMAINAATDRSMVCALDPNLGAMASTSI